MVISKWILFLVSYKAIFNQSNCLCVIRLPVAQHMLDLTEQKVWNAKGKFMAQFPHLQEHKGLIKEESSIDTYTFNWIAWNMFSYQTLLALVHVLMIPMLGEKARKTWNGGEHTCRGINLFRFPLWRMIVTRNASSTCGRFILQKLLPIAKIGYPTPLFWRGPYIGGHFIYTSVDIQTISKHLH